MEERFDSVVFRSNFDSGNFGTVEKINNNQEDLLEFKVWTKPDCGGTQYENGNRTWFHFSVSGVPSHKTLKITMCNLNKQSKLYSQGMSPVYRTVPGKIKWERIKDRPSHEMIEGRFHLTFTHTVLDSKISTYFAFVYPFSYTDLQKKLDLIESRFMSQAWNLATWKPGETSPTDAIYYHSTTLCYTLKNLKVQLLTISSPHGMCEKREAPLANLFPDGPSSLPRKFSGKKVYFISSRVHPGEVPASFVLNGFLNFLLRPNDPRAALLRQLFVFKVVPMLNPDGVFMGHYRTDSRGVNLNRYYTNPCPKLHPSIYGAKAVVMYHHRAGRDCVCGGDTKFVRQRGEETAEHHPPETSERLNKQVQSIISNLQKDIDCSDGEFRFKMEQRVSEICSKMAKLSQETQERVQDMNDNSSRVQLRTTARPTGELTDPDQNIEVRACVCGSTPAPSPTNRHILETGGGIPEKVRNESGVEMYMDLHGHASKRGCFVYGNNLDDEKQIDNILYPRLIAYNSVHFDFQGCCFTERNMYAKDKSDGLSKEGSGRVGIYKSTGIVHSYTLECNYNVGRGLNPLPAASKDGGRATPPLTSAFAPKYTPESWEEVGKALALALLDLHNVNPWTRLANTDVVNVHGLRGLMVRTSKGNSNTGPGVLRRLAYATSKMTSTDNPKPPRPARRAASDSTPARRAASDNRHKHSLKRIAAATRVDNSKDSESDSCGKSDPTKRTRGKNHKDTPDKSHDKSHDKTQDKEGTDSSSGNSKSEKRREKSTLHRQTSASLAKRSEKVKKGISSEELITSPVSEEDRSPDISVQYRSLYSGVYKMDTEEDKRGASIKKIHPPGVLKAGTTEKQTASLCNFVDLSEPTNTDEAVLAEESPAAPVNIAEPTRLIKQVNLSSKSLNCGRSISTSHIPHSKIPKRSNTTGYYPSLRQGRPTKKTSKSKSKDWVREWQASETPTARDLDEPIQNAKVSQR